MSVGDRRHVEESTPEELHHALSHPAVQAVLEQPAQEDFTHHIPLTGGSNVSGTTYYGDKSLPTSLRPFVMVHERVEKAVRSGLGLKYPEAHKLATAAEKMAVEHAGHNWAAYKKAVDGPVRRDENEPQADVPPDLDHGPFKG